MSTHHTIDALSDKADIFRQPPHALFTENADTLARPSVDAEVNKLALNMRSGHAENISRDSMVRWAQNTGDDNLTPEEKEEKERKRAVTRAAQTVSIAMAEHYNKYDGQLLSDLDWARKQKERYPQEINDVRERRAAVEPKAQEAEERLKEAQEEEAKAIAEHDAAAGREQAAEEYGVQYDEDRNGYTPHTDTDGNVLYYVKYDEQGRPLRVSVEEVEGGCLTSEELAQDTADAAQKADQAGAVTDAAAAEVAKYKAYMEYLDKFESILIQREAEMEQLVKDMEQEHREFRDDFKAYKEGQMTEADFLAKYPDKTDRVEAYKKWQAEEEAFKRDHDDLLNGNISQEQFYKNQGEFLEKNEARQERAKDREAVKNKEMTREEFEEKYPSGPRTRGGARREYAEKKEALEDIHEGSKALATQRERLANDEVAQRIERGEITFQQALQEYGADPHFYNDFADRHGNMDKIVVAEVTPTQSDTPWYQSISDWFSGSQSATQIASADPAPTTSTEGTATALASADGQGINAGTNLSNAFNSSTTGATPEAAPEQPAPVVVAQQKIHAASMTL